MVLQNEALDKEKILRVEDYAMTFFGTVKQKYLDLISQYEKEQD
jgi:hypothetical protein